ncbi:ATP-binding protein, partial [Streptomyces fradiae]
MTQDWQFEVPITGSKHLPPDARYMEALSSQGYGFEVAIADLVDNSIDAGAEGGVLHKHSPRDGLGSQVRKDESQWDNH